MQNRPVKISKGRSVPVISSVSFAKPSGIGAIRGAFSDRLNDYHLLAGYDEYQIEITNPCGEFGGNAYNACNLGSINLYNMIDDKFGNAPF